MKDYEISDEQRNFLNAVLDQYIRHLGPEQGVHHIVPTSLWLHPLAEYVKTFPPTSNRPTWLYASCALSALSKHDCELILERPTEDIENGRGNVARLMQYYLEMEPLDIWHTMGPGEVFGDKSTLRGFLFCPPPKGIPRMSSRGGKVNPHYLCRGDYRSKLVESPGVG